ncbi:MAG: hypothetical protein Q4P28_05045 [Tissierellia bacterium]|nr:hypothetical protein [Tissierellia bacterium]
MEEHYQLMKPKEISLKDHPILNEAWLQDVIIKDPGLLGLGDLVIKDKERIQTSGGRLDLLLQDIDSMKRYEMEIQLGKTDESHIIRTIEYWDIERKRYPQYEHCAVIVAEDITSRFLNVISLFNGNIPLIALKVTAYEYEKKYFVIFNKILDEVQLGLVDDDEEISELADRNYWLNRGTPKTVAIVDEVLGIIKEIAPEYELKYNKFYIGLMNHGIANNFVLFRPRKNATRMEIRLKKDPSLVEKIEESGIEFLDYFSGRYRINLKPGEVQTYEELIKELLERSLNIEK